MYGKINRENIQPNSKETTMALREEAAHYSKYRREYDELRKAYLQDYITKQELKTLRGQLKSGDATGAMKGLAVLMGRWTRHV